MLLTSSLYHLALTFAIAKKLQHPLGYLLDLVRSQNTHAFESYRQVTLKKVSSWVTQQRPDGAQVQAALENLRHPLGYLLNLVRSQNTDAFKSYRQITVKKCLRG